MYVVYYKCILYPIFGPNRHHVTDQPFRNVETMSKYLYKHLNSSQKGGCTKISWGGGLLAPDSQQYVWKMVLVSLSINFSENQTLFFPVTHITNHCDRYP